MRRLPDISPRAAILASSWGRRCLSVLSLLVVACSPADHASPQRWIAAEPEESFPLERLEEELPPSELRAIAARPWKVALGSDQRNALLAVAADPFERQMRIPADGAMRLEYGVACTTESAFAEVAPVRLEVLVGRGGRDPEPVWEARLDREDRDQALRWSEAVIDLSRHRGRLATVSIRASTAAAPAAPIPCLVALGNPEVTSRAEEERALNVIFISVDTLRADRLSLYGNSREATPEIDAWARTRATTFATTVAQAAWTLPSHVSMLTGVDPFNHGVNYNSPAPASLRFLAEIFRQAGYTTTAVTGGGWMNPQFGFSRGFDRYEAWPSGDNERELEENLDRFLDWLEGNTDRRFFALFHTYEPHGPYRPRQPFLDRFYDGPLRDRVDEVDWGPPRPNTGVVDRRVEFFWRQGSETAAPSTEAMLELVSALYDSGVAYVDAQFGRLLRRLRELGIEERTAIVFTSDHGEALGEHGLQGHGYPHDHNLLVPLVIAAPDMPAPGGRVETQVRSIDIAPTLLELAGLPPLEGIDGRSLVPLMRGEASGFDPEAWAFAPKGNWGVALRVGSELKYVYNDSPWSGLRGRESLYFLEQDPAELDDQAAGTREAELLRGRVRERMETIPAFRVRLSNATAEPLRGRLRGSLAQPQKIKSVDMPCDCLQWIPRGTAEFEVPAGASYALFFHDAPGGVLTVEGLSLEGRPEIEPAESLRIDVSELDGSRTLTLNDDRWELAEGYRDGDVTGLSFWWSGDVHHDPTDPTTTDATLADQLRALGYLE